MEGTCGRALSPVLSSKLWLKLFSCTSSEFHPAASAVPKGKKEGIMRTLAALQLVQKGF